MVSVFLSAVSSTAPLCAAEEGDEPPGVLLRYGALQLWPSRPFHLTVSIFSRCSYSKPSSLSGMSNSVHTIGNRQALSRFHKVLSRLLLETPSELFYTVEDQRGDCNHRSGNSYPLT